MTETDKLRKGRRNVPLFITLPPDERDRVASFAAKVGRPLSWVVRDALSVYLDAVENDAGKLAALRADVQAPKVDPRKAGKTKPPRRGRPPRLPGSAFVLGVDPDNPDAARVAALPDLDKLDAAAIQDLVDKLTAAAPKGKKG